MCYLSFPLVWQLLGVESVGLLGAPEGHHLLPLYPYHSSSSEL